MAEQHSCLESRLAYSLHQLLWNPPYYVISIAHTQRGDRCAERRQSEAVCLWRHGGCFRRQQCEAWFKIKACIREFLPDAPLTDTGIEYIAAATPAGFSLSDKPYSERAADYERGCNTEA
jgi:hypothetical protein